MTEAEKIERVQALLGGDEEATDTLIAIYLDDAEQAIMSRIYPFGVPTDAEMPARYESIQCKLAQRYFLRRGAEGEISHHENGVNRSYDSVDRANRKDNRCKSVCNFLNGTSRQSNTRPTPTK